MTGGKGVPESEKGKKGESGKGLWKLVDGQARENKSEEETGSNLIKQITSKSYDNAGKKVLAGLGCSRSCACSQEKGGGGATKLSELIVEGESSIGKIRSRTGRFRRAQRGGGYLNLGDTKRVLLYPGWSG